VHNNVSIIDELRHQPAIFDAVKVIFHAGGGFQMTDVFHASGGKIIQHYNVVAAVDQSL
jgi:hypothetical protein